MTKKRREYHVTILDADGVEVEHVVEVRAGDQLRGELEAKKAGLPDAKEAPLNQVSVWVWCAMVRLDLYHDKYPAFRNRDLVDFDNVKDDADPDGEGVGDGLDPTRPEDSTTSASPSPASTETPDSGSTPNSTPG